MKCQKCGEAEATVRLTEIVGGTKKVRHLCKACVDGVGFVIDLPTAAKEPIMPAPATLAGAAFGELTKSLVPIQEETAELSCPRCGLTWPEFRKSSRLGCPDDYDVFGAHLEVLLSQYHGNSEHAGSVPESRAHHLGVERERRAQANHRADLEDRLQTAIEAEEYERAAQLRDEISRLPEADSDG